MLTDYFQIGSDSSVCKTFSAGAAAQKVFGKASTAIFGLQSSKEPEEREQIERQIHCRKQLIIMKARNAEAAEERETGGRPVIQQEDLQEWLDELQLRLNQACAVADNSIPQTSRSRSRNRSLPKSAVPGLLGSPNKDSGFYGTVQLQRTGRYKTFIKSNSFRIKYYRS